MDNDDGNRMKRRIYTTGRTGNRVEPIRYNLVEEVHGLTLKNAIDMLPRLPKKYCRASAIMFHKVLPMRRRDIRFDIDWQYIQNELRDVALAQSLQPLKPKLLYRADNTRYQLSDVNNLTIAENISETGRALSADTGSCFANKAADSNYVEEVMSRITKNGHKSLYYYNSTWRPRGYESRLDGVLSHLSPSVNTDIADCPGINTPMFYVGFPNSYTPMHVEDGLADSINILRDGHPKLWFIVNSYHYGRLNESLARALHTVETYEYRSCPLPVGHKDLFISPRFLDENNIDYALIVQKPGDMLYIRHRVSHQVINIGKNIAEAINYGSHEWNATNDATSRICSCGKNAITPLVTNYAAQWSIQEPMRIIVFNCDLCADESFVTAHDLQKHNLSVHNAKYVCPHCDDQFGSQSSMSRHSKNRHGVGLRGMPKRIAIPEQDDMEEAGPSTSTGCGSSRYNMRNRNRITCEICKKDYVDIRAHTRKMHGWLSKCEMCNKSFTQWDLKVHQQETCRPRFPCEACGNIYFSKRALTQHLRQTECGTF